jgi:hypothetical protein
MTSAHHFLDVNVIHDPPPYAVVISAVPPAQQPGVGSHNGAQAALRLQQFSVR